MSARSSRNRAVLPVPVSPVSKREGLMVLEQGALQLVLGAQKVVEGIGGWVHGALGSCGSGGTPWSLWALIWRSRSAR